jgi:hypothetical protein
MIEPEYAKATYVKSENKWKVYCPIRPADTEKD